MNITMYNLPVRVCANYSGICTEHFGMKEAE